MLKKSQDLRKEMNRKCTKLHIKAAKYETQNPSTID